MAAAGAAALMSSAPAMAEDPAPVTIGVIDTRPSSTATVDGVSIEYRHFGMAGYKEGVEQVTASRTHGDMVLDAVRGARSAIGDRRPYRVLHANPFVDKDGRLGINYGGMSSILEWYRENGVRVVSTTFAAGKEDPRMASFMSKAQDYGITIVASVGNGEMDGVPFPAANPSAIAIDGVNYRSMTTRRTPAYRRAEAVFSGATGVKTSERLDDALTQTMKAGSSNASKEVLGSSFAVPRAVVVIASRLTPGQGPDDARRLIASIARKDAPVDLATLPAPSAAVVVAEAPPAREPAGQRPSAAVLAAMAGGVSR